MSLKRNMSDCKIGLSVFFTPSEKDAIQRYADRRRLVLSKAIEKIVREELSLTSQEDYEELAYVSVLEERVNNLEHLVEKATDAVYNQCKRNEVLEEQLSFLEGTVEGILQTLKDMR